MDNITTSAIYNSTTSQLCKDRYKLLQNSSRYSPLFIKELNDIKINRICTNFHKITDREIDNADISLILKIDQSLPKVYMYDPKCALKIAEVMNKCINIQTTELDKDKCKVLINLRKLCSWNGMYSINLKLNE
jgi:hypothetical protein